MVRQSPRAAHRRAARRPRTSAALLAGVTLLGAAGAAGCSSSASSTASSAASSAGAVAQSLASAAQSAAQSLASQAASAGASAASGLSSEAAAAAASAQAAASSAVAGIQGGFDASGDVTLGSVLTASDGRSEVPVAVTNHQTDSNRYTVEITFKDSSDSVVDAVVVNIPTLAAGQTAHATARSNRSLTGPVTASVDVALRY
ncbi:cell division septum initiation protein DivIVA [Kitasatospora sp. MAP12-15]|uniref:hypothetical protein n=1 Tax=unclassified Kitasatospora TaxID=2633591 RepID=UPI0024739121|nr:hypothetical protein [Kitasatospora sp. MAP12-44]MDH6110305.1 cell division septum initiation protein DivIVA [Kitasatospora sp. MAP12-44]